MSQNEIVNAELKFSPVISNKMDYMRIEYRLNAEKEEENKLRVKLNQLTAELSTQQSIRDKEIQQVISNKARFEAFIAEANEEKRAITTQLEFVSAIYKKLDSLEGMVLLKGLSGVDSDHSTLELKAIDQERDLWNADLVNLRSREDLKLTLLSLDTKIKALNEKISVENNRIHDVSKLALEAQLNQSIEAVKAQILDVQNKQVLVGSILAKAKQDLSSPVNFINQLQGIGHPLMGANDEKRTGQTERKDVIELDKVGKELLKKIQAQRKSLFPTIHSDKKAKDKDLVLQQYEDYIQGRSDKSKVDAAKAHGTSWALRRSFFCGNSTFRSTTKKLCDAVDGYQLNKRNGK